ncbi:PBP1A family penicillin-binding protein [Virgibacillus flavescens]|uniref:transglycosylase domain-containing protein n=1 Tax=Virgibacillus flavescens TaxID=1611422 RepID=UPI003D347229
MSQDSQSRTGRRKQKKGKKKPLWKRIVLIVLIMGLAMMIGVGALFTYYIATAPEIDASKLSEPFSSKIYDKDGELFADLGSEQRTRIEYSDLPPVLIDAVIATEDSRFFEHPGIDIWRIGGAVVSNITNGFGSEGASTITQQVVEKSFLSPEKKISLKVQEQWLALKLEQKYSKKEIMEMYLNKIYYGSGAYGVAKAAEVYFGITDLSKLSLPQAAILAGLPQRPSAYNPFESPELMKDRMNTVLNLMVMHGKITEKEAEEAKKVDIPSLLKKSNPDDNDSYAAFLQKVKAEVAAKLDGADIYTDGLKIYTTLDTNAQEYVEFLMSDAEDNPIPYYDKEMQAGMVVLDTQNGAIRAIGGGRKSLENDGFNYALDIKRQPGSTFKPIISYGPAIEYNKWSTYHQVNDDKPYEIKGSEGNTIRNWNREYSGWMSIRTALAESLNVPAVKTLEETGYDKAQQFAEGLGIEYPDDSLTIGDAIGGTGNSSTNPLELAGAYRAFANEGIYNEPYTVTKVVFPSGKEVDTKPEPEAVMSEYTAYMMSDMLKTAITEGSGANADIPGLEVAGKTGTTNRDGVDNAVDSWFSGYTTNYTISVWTGYDSEKVGIKDTQIPHALFKYTMKELSKDKETADFQKPDSVVEVAVEEGSRPAKLPSEYTPESEIVTELFVKGNTPSKTSEKYDQLDPVSGLSAKYNKDSQAIQVNWDYESNDAEFKVSASIDGGAMQELSSTQDKSLEISNVEPGTDYEIQVIAISKDDSGSTSEAKTTRVKVPDNEDKEEKEDEDKENEGDPEGEDESGESGNVNPVTGISASYDSANKSLTFSWKYQGAKANFNVSVSPGGISDTASSNSYTVPNVKEGETYTITIVAVGNNGEQSEPVKGETTVPASDPESGTGDGNSETQSEGNSARTSSQGNESNNNSNENSNSENNE